MDNSIEITFQNKPDDIEAFRDYWFRETQEGKHFSAHQYRRVQRFLIITMLVFGIYLSGITGSWMVSFLIAILIFLGTEAVIFIQAGFKPRRYMEKQVAKREIKSMTPEQLQLFLLPKTVTADETWFGVQNSEVSYRCRWRQVSHIGVTLDFIFILIENGQPVYIIPKRDFLSEQDFLEVKKRFVELQEKYKGQPLGTE